MRVVLFVVRCRFEIPIRISLGHEIRSGVRAQALTNDGSLVDDFLIERHRHALHVRNAPSPAATASFAIAKHVVDQIVF